MRTFIASLIIGAFFFFLMALIVYGMLRLLYFLSGDNWEASTYAKLFPSFQPINAKGLASRWNFTEFNKSEEKTPARV